MAKPSRCAIFFSLTISHTRPDAAGNDQFRLREAFVEAGHLFEDQPDAKFWAGDTTAASTLTSTISIHWT